MRSTRSHTANRRSHHFLTAAGLIPCPDCKTPKIKHAVCLNCGKYKGRQVLDVHSKIAKKEKKAKEKRVAAGK